MCGICGYINPKGVRKETINRMLVAMKHRGPDGQGIFTRDTVALGHQRLSIIDLEGGSQPMTNEDESVWITFNGEIYNYLDIRRDLDKTHQFKTQSDTEVILHLYEEKGEKCISELRGMFAFVIYDFRERKLFAARDHLGQKPLYYNHEGCHFSFASEIKSLLALKPELAELDETALYEYLTIRIITPPRSMFRRIRKLAPGHFLVWRDGKIRVERYWQLRYEPKLQMSFDDVLNELEERVMTTVKYHLISDVPVGAFLSGGLDSSLVVAMMSKVKSEPFMTFSGDVPYKNFSEISYADSVAEKYRTKHHRITILPSLIHSLTDVVWHLDEPSDALSVCIFYLSEFTRKHVKVVLGGDGGDELFGGYDRYYGNVLVSHYALLPEIIRRQIIEKLMRIIPEGSWYRSFSHQIKWMHQMSFYESGERYAKSLSYFYFSDGFKKALYTDRFKRSVGLFEPEAVIKSYFDSTNAEDAIDKMLYTDSMTRMPDHPNMILDRMTMAHGLEARAPFMDYKLAEFCAAIPSKFKIKGKKTRYIQVELAKKYLPRALIGREKQGFSSSLPYMLSDEFRKLFSVFLRNSSLVAGGYLQYDLIQKLLNEHLNGQKDHANRLWLLCNAEVWFRMYIEKQSNSEIKTLMQNSCDMNL